MKFRKMLLLVLVFLSVTLYGCSNNSKDSTIIVGVASLNAAFNPLYVSTIYDSYVIDLVYDTLLSRDINGNRCVNLAKDLPTISDDYKTYTFQLKDNIYFSNHEKLSAEDVVFSFTLLADPTYDGMYNSIVENMSGYEAYKNNVTDIFTGVEAVDEHTVVFHFNEGYRTNIDSVASLGIMCKATYPDYEKGNLDSLKKSITKPIGSGPYVLDNYHADTGAVLHKNKYYDRGGYEIENVLIKPVDQSSVTLEMEKSNIDAVFEVSDPSFIKVASGNDDLVLNDYNSAGLSWLTLNCAYGATADRNVRKALSMAFDKHAFVEHYFACTNDKEEIELAYVPSIFQNPISSLKEYVLGTKTITGIENDSYDIAAANALLEESGWIMNDDGFRYQNGERLIVKFMSAEEQQSVDTMITMWKRDFTAIGVDFRVTNVEFNTMIAKAMNDHDLGEWNAFVLSTVFSSDDLDSIYTLFHSSSAGNGGNNFARLKSNTVDDLLEKGRAELNIDKADEIYLRLAVAIHNEYANLPIYATQKFDIFNQRIKNLKTSSYYPWTKALKDAKLN